MPVSGTLLKSIKTVSSFTNIMKMRRTARESALKILYQMEVQNISPEESLGSYWHFNRGREEIIDFSNRIVRGVASREEEIDGIIKRHAKNWKLERIALIDRNILRMAIYEFIEENETPPPSS